MMSRTYNVPESTIRKLCDQWMMFGIGLGLIIGFVAGVCLSVAVR